MLYYLYGIWFPDMAFIGQKSILHIFMFNLWWVGHCRVLNQRESKI